MSDEPVGSTKQPGLSPSAVPRQWRKKPVVIEAVKVPMREYADAPMVFEDVPEWLSEAIHCGRIRAEFRSEDYYYFVIATLEGDMTASPGDMIIRGVKGELCPCKPDIFTATYEPAPASAAPRLEIIETLKELEEFISELASSAMLSGEEFPEEDKGAFYSEACKAKNKLTWLIDELAPSAAPSQDSPAKCPSCGSRDGIRMCMVANCGESHLEPTEFSNTHAKVACSDSWHSRAATLICWDGGG
jgi:hypothetical protein